MERKKRFGRPLKTAFCALMALLVAGMWGATPIGRAAQLPVKLTGAYGDAAGLTGQQGLTRASTLDVDTGMLLGGLNGEAQFTPTGGAVTMMTADLVLQEHALDEVVEITAEMLSAVPENAMKAGLKGGDNVTVKDLIATMTLTGAQDSAQALAVYAAGSPEAFVQKMNARADELGMIHTHYTNATGIYDGAQKTATQDLLRLAYSLYKEEKAGDLFSQASIPLTATGTALKSEAVNRVEMMVSSSAAYDERVKAAFGAGSSAQEGYNTVVVAQVEGMQVIAVCCGNGNGAQVYPAISSLLDTLGEQYQRVDLAEPIAQMLEGVKDGDRELTAQIEGNIFVSAAKGWQPAEGALAYTLVDRVDPPAENALYAYAAVTLGGEPVARIPLNYGAVTEPLPPQIDPDGQTADSLAPQESAPYRQSLYDRYGWIFWIVASAVLGGVVLLICNMINKRMK